MAAPIIPDYSWIPRQIGSIIQDFATQLPELVALNRSIKENQQNNETLYNEWQGFINNISADEDLVSEMASAYNVDQTEIINLLSKKTMKPGENESNVEYTKKLQGVVNEITQIAGNAGISSDKLAAIAMWNPTGEIPETFQDFYTRQKNSEGYEKFAGETFEDINTAATQAQTYGVQKGSPVYETKMREAATAYANKIKQDPEYMQWVTEMASAFDPKTDEPIAYITAFRQQFNITEEQMPYFADDIKILLDDFYYKSKIQREDSRAQAIEERALKNANIKAGEDKLQARHKLIQYFNQQIDDQASLVAKHQTESKNKELSEEEKLRHKNVAEEERRVLNWITEYRNSIKNDPGYDPTKKIVSGIPQVRSEFKIEMTRKAAEAISTKTGGLISRNKSGEKLADELQAITGYDYTYDPEEQIFFLTDDPYKTPLAKLVGADTKNPKIIAYVKSLAESLIKDKQEPTAATGANLTGRSMSSGERPSLSTYGTIGQ